MNISYQIINVNKFKLLALVSGLFLVACGPSAQNFSILASGQTAYQGSTANNKVDVLWVIDNSGSMLTKQTSLATSFDSFTQIFLDKGFDFHMAIVTTDTRNDPGNPIVADRGQNGLFQGFPTVITQDTANFSATFKANVVVGALGDSAAKALDATILSLDTVNLVGANSGFIRSDAHLAVIYVSDADDDDSAASESDVTTFLNTLKPDLYDETSQTYKKNFTISAVINDPNVSAAACPAPTEEGLKFEDLATTTNGSIASVCEVNFAAGLINISQTIVAAITEIPLGRAPQVDTITVTFNGVTIPEDSTNGWSYSSTLQAIQFHGFGIPLTDTAIAVNYIPNDIIR